MFMCVCVCVCVCVCMCVCSRNQQRNHRYANFGRRIDYILVDAPLRTHVLAGPPLVGDESADGAKRAVTAGGRWLPAPTHGVLSGLQDASMSTHDTQFAPGPHTGILYTAPQASDHVAVTLLLDAKGSLGRIHDAQQAAADAAASTRAPLDAATKACSYRPQASLKAFFAPKPKRPADEEAGQQPTSSTFGTTGAEGKRPKT